MKRKVEKRRSLRDYENYPCRECPHSNNGMIRTAQSNGISTCGHCKKWEEWFRQAWKYMQNKYVKKGKVK